MRAPARRPRVHAYSYVRMHPSRGAASASLHEAGPAGPHRVIVMTHLEGAAAGRPRPVAAASPAGYKWGACVCCCTDAPMRAMARRCWPIVAPTAASLTGLAL